VRLHADLLRLRREDPALAGRAPCDGAVLTDHAFVLRFFAGEAADRLLVVNLGPDLRLEPAPEPLLAPPPESGWRLLWSSDDLSYGGPGPVPLETNPYWQVPAESAHLLIPHAERELPRAKMAEKD
jgi:maltooligosyltrehalose trehalohydrolase